MRLDELLRKRKSVRKFRIDPVSISDIDLLLEAARLAPSAGGIRPISIYVNKNVWKACPQKTFKSAPVILIFCADFPKIQRKYGDRGNRYALLEAGHMAQNVCLKAVELGLATCCIGAFKDKKVKAILGCEESPVYMIAVGRKR